MNLPAGGVAFIEGILIDMRGFASAGSGLAFTGAGTLQLKNTTIRNAFNGIEFRPTGAGNLLITDTVLANNTTFGLLVQPSGSGSAKVVIDGLTATGNTGGVYAGAATVANSIQLEIRNSVLSENSNFGLASRSIGNGVSSVLVENASVSNNGSVGLASRGAKSRLLVGRSTIVGNQTGMSVIEGGALLSYGNNNVSNLTAAGGPSGTIGQQ